MEAEGDQKREVYVLESLMNRPLEPNCLTHCPRYFYRSFDGSCNWLEEGQSTWGMAVPALKF